MLIAEASAKATADDRGLNATANTVTHGRKGVGLHKTERIDQTDRQTEKQADKQTLRRIGKNTPNLKHVITR